MRATAIRTGLWAAAVVLLGCGIAAQAADAYKVDPDHSSVTFKIEHSGISWIHGRFNDVVAQAQAS